MSHKPNFFIVGAPRCGTTAMYDYLKAHPDVAMSSYKEPHYFGSDLSGARYEMFRDKHDQYLRLFSHANPQQRIGEASVYYLFSKRAAQEIHQYTPEAKIIIMLRHPVSVLESLFTQGQLTGDIPYETLGEMLATTAEMTKFDSSRHAFLSGAGVEFADQVQRYMTTFGEENVHIILYEDFRADTAAEYRKTLDFLGVDASFQPEFKIVNARRQVRNPLIHQITSNKTLIRIGSKFPLISLPIYRAIKVLNAKPAEKKQTICPALRAQLIERFEPNVRQLATIIQRDLSHWLV